jgi:hypothetical protein
VPIGVQLSGSEPLDDPPLDDPPLDDPPLDDPPLDDDVPPLEEEDPPLDDVDPPDEDELPVLPDDPPEDEDVLSCWPVSPDPSSVGEVGTESLPVSAGDDVVVVAQATVAEQAKANAKRSSVRMSPV